MRFLNKIKFFGKSSHWIRFILIYKKQVLLLFLLSLFSSCLALVTPYLSKLFIDQAFINKDFAKFLNLSVLGAGIFIFTMLFKAIEDIVRNRIAIKLKFNLARKFIKKFYALDLSFFQSKSVGENIYRLSDVENTANFILEQTPAFLTDIIKLFIILAVSFWINARITILVVILSPLFILHSIYLQKKLMPVYEEIWKHSALFSKKIYEAFSGILIIIAFGLGTFQKREYLRGWIKNIRWRLKSFRWTIINSLSSSLLSKAIYGAITLYGGWMILKGSLSLGSYTAVMLYLGQLGALLISLGNTFTYFAQEAVSVNKFFEIMDTESRIKDQPQAKSLVDASGEIDFSGVYFGYNGKAVIRDLNFKIPPGSWIGIAGPSGCGKSTLINLILRLYDPQKGRISIGGLDLKEAKLSSLRCKIAIATQEPLLFDLSIADNIGYGLKDAAKEEIIEASKICCLHDFISGLADGYDTLIGEGACRLSQGLKQRIAIARAILRNPQLLILDEATASVDSLTEQKILSALRQKRQGLSTIIVSHRLFSIKDAQKIYFLRADGSLEEGSHIQLFSDSASYREFFSHQ